MAIISKEIFYEKVGNHLKCYDLHVAAPDCWKFKAYFTPHMMYGTAKFFLPIYIVKALLKYKELDQKYFLATLKELGISTVYGVAFAQLLVGTVCTYCNVMGRLDYFVVGKLAGFICALSVLVESKENRRLDRLLFFNLAIEGFLRMLNHNNQLVGSRLNYTIIFMITSSLTMYLIENRQGKLPNTYFWFYTVPKLEKEGDAYRNCTHPKNCLQNSLKGLYKYFAIGYALGIIKQLIPKMALLVQKPSKIFKVLFNKSNIKFGLVFGNFVFLYKALSCLLLKYGKVPRELHSMIAGLVSGSTFAIEPNVQLLCASISMLLLMLHEKIKSRGIKWFDNEFSSQLLFMVSNGYLLHLAFFAEKICPNYYINMLTVCTNSEFTNLKELLVKYMI